MQFYEDVRHFSRRFHHFWPFLRFFGVKNASKWPKIGPKWDKNGPKLSKMGHFLDVILDHFWDVLGSFWHRFGIISGSFWGRFDSILRSVWAIFGPFSAIFGSSLFNFLGHFYAHFCTFSGVLFLRSFCGFLVVHWVGLPIQKWAKWGIECKNMQFSPKLTKKWAKLCKNEPLLIYKTLAFA